MTPNTKIHCVDGTNFFVESGGSITIKSGGSLTVQSGGSIDLDAATLNLPDAVRFPTSLAVGGALPTNPQAQFSLAPAANASGVTANQSYYHGSIIPGGALTIPTGTAPIVASLNIAEPNITATGTVTDAVTLRIADAPTEGSANWALWVDAGATRLDGTTYIGATSNAKVTLGLTVNQGTADDEILALKSGTDVAHGMTDVTETDTYGRFLKFSATDGGLFIDGLADTGGTGLQLRGVMVTDSATRSTSGVAPVMIDSALKSTTTVTTNAADKNIMCVRNSGTTRFILDSDGDSFQDVGTAWTNFDDHDDLTLLNSLSHHVAREGNQISEAFGGWLQANKAKLESLKLVSFNEDTDSRPFVNMSKLTMLLTGAVRQIGLAYQNFRTEMLGRLQTLEAKLLPAAG